MQGVFTSANYNDTQKCVSIGIDAGPTDTNDDNSVVIGTRVVLNPQQYQAEMLD